MKKTIRKSELITLLNTINSVLSEKRDFPAKFNYALVRNKKKITGEVQTIYEAINKLQEPFHKERIVLCEKYALKDKDGQYIIKNESYQFGASQAVFDKQLQELTEKHKPELSEVSDFLASDIELDFHMVRLSEVPELSGTKQEGLDAIIEE